MCVLFKYEIQTYCDQTCAVYSIKYNSDLLKTENYLIELYFFLNQYLLDTQRNYENNILFSLTDSLLNYVFFRAYFHLRCKEKKSYLNIFKSEIYFCQSNNHSYSIVVLRSLSTVIA